MRIFSAIFRYTAGLNPFYNFLKKKGDKVRPDYSFLAINLSATGALFFIISPVKYYFNQEKANSLGYWNITDNDIGYLPDDLSSLIEKASIYAGFHDLLPGLLNGALWGYARIVAPGIVVLDIVKDVIDRHYLAKYSIVQQRLALKARENLDLFISGTSSRIGDEIEKSFTDAHSAVVVAEKVKNRFYNDFILRSLDSISEGLGKQELLPIFQRPETLNNSMFLSKQYWYGFFRYPSGRLNFPNVMNLMITIAVNLLYNLLNKDCEQLGKEIETQIKNITATYPWQDLRVSTIDSFSSAGEVVFPGGIWSTLVQQAIKQLGIPVGLLLIVQIFKFAASFAILWLTKSSAKDNNKVGERTPLVGNFSKPGENMEELQEVKERNKEVQIFCLPCEGAQGAYLNPTH